MTTRRARKGWPWAVIFVLFMATLPDTAFGHSVARAGSVVTDQEELVRNLASSTGSCGVERWPVKTATDPDVGLINMSSATATTIATMRSYPQPGTLPDASRIQPQETTQYSIYATLTEYKLETDSDYHLVIQDAAGNTMIVEIADPACAGGSPLLSSIQNARKEFDSKLAATTSFQTTSIPVRIVGIGFFDFLHGQTGVAPNGIELHPVLDVTFNPTISATVGCTSVAISTDVPSPQSVGVAVGLSAAAAGCGDPSPLYQFWLRDISGVWRIAQPYSANSAFTWNTNSSPPGTYLTGVWVKDVQSTKSYDSYAFGTFTLTLQTCASTNLSADVGSPQAVGVTVNFTASSLGCPDPLYQWWVRDTAGTWRIAVPFGAASTFAWVTATLGAGTYQVGVWARQRASSASYDAFAFVTYTLTVATCKSVSLATDRASPQPVMTSVTMTPAATGCANPQFRFYVRDLNATWHVVQDYGAGATYVWTANSAVSTSNAGTYLLGVWAREPGSTNAYDAFAFVTFSLTAANECTVNIAGDQSSPQTLGGSSVLWTASANACLGAPLAYQFWVSPPGGTWRVVQPYASSNTFAWTPSAPGTYQVGVWVKQSGSPNSYDNFAFTTFTITPTAPPQVCSSVGVTSDVASPRAVGTQVTLTASAGGCDQPQYEWWVRDVNANWSIAIPYVSSTATFAWNTTTLPPGTYLLGVWARQLGSAASYEAYSFITYKLTGPPTQACVAVNLAPDQPSTQLSGTVVVFTAAVVGCSAPYFRFFVAPPSTGVFGEVQPYSVTGTYRWDTTGLMAGPYQVGVWARQQGSTSSYEAFAFITYSITAAPGSQPCTSVSINPDLSSPQTPGPTVTFTATAETCGKPDYQFLVAPPATGVFSLAQTYSSLATFAWSTAGLAPGQYQIGVWARQEGSVASYDAYKITAFVLSAPDLCGAPPNPWNYNFCGGSLITSPPSSFCSYFRCISSFWSGAGYVVECVDAMYSKSGGLTGVCSQHGGFNRNLYSP